MWHYGAIDKTPTVNQIKSIIDYMITDESKKYNFNWMMEMMRVEPNIIILNLNNAVLGNKFKIVFSTDNEIESFENIGSWIS